MPTPSQIKSNYQTRRQQISNDKTLSAAGKQKQLAALYLQTKQSLAAAATAADTDTTSRHATLEQKLFGLGTLATTQDRLSYRDAQDRVRAATTDAELNTILRDAQRTGDSILAKAVLAQGFDNKDVAVINAYLGDHPELEGDAQELLDLNNPTFSEGLAEAASYYLPAPPEIAQYSPTQITAIAEN